MNQESTRAPIIMRPEMLLTLVLAFPPPAFLSTSLAQVTTTISPTTGGGGLGTTVTTDGHTVQITDGTRPGNGPNLFHSFDQFNVGRGDTAQFLNTTPSLSTSNILSRVTGGDPSSIFGAIDTTSYPGANLFLMNPAGIVFGPNATLNVGGSVAFTTADYLRLTNVDGTHAGIFRADSTATSLLTSASVAAFGFLGSNPAAIAVQGSTLTVQPEQSISLIGGTITAHSGTLENGTIRPAYLSAPSGQISIASVASPGEVLVGTLGQAPNINGQSFEALGTVQILQQSVINTSGEGGGTILIRGGRLVVDDSIISANTKAAGLNIESKVDLSGAGVDIQVAQDAVMDNGAVIETNVEPGAHHGSGGVRITANDIAISGGPKIIRFVEGNPEAKIPFAGIRSNIKTKSTAISSGNITLNAASILIKDLGQIETKTENMGNAGHIVVKASGSIDTDFTKVRSISENSSGHAGNIMFMSSQGNVNFTNTEVTSQSLSSNGNAGSITMNAPEGSIFLTGTQVFNSIDGGNGVLGGIQVSANNLFLQNESSIDGDNLAKQVAGNIAIMLNDRLSLTGSSTIDTSTHGKANAADLIIRSPQVLIGDRSALITSTTSSGNAGQLSLSTEQLHLSTGGRLSGRSLKGADGEIPSGRAGVISVQGITSYVASVVIDGSGSGIFTNTEGTGAGGTINLSAKSLTIQNGGTISAETSGTASSAIGGSTEVTATDHVIMTDRASITSSSKGPADAGKISINAGQQLDVQDSSITTKAEKASGGNIDIKAVDSIRFTNSTISASVGADRGNGGNITIDPNVVVLQNSNILAQAARGQGGNITITTPAFLQDQTSRVDASSQFGVNGTVTIQSPTSNLSGTVAQLASKPSPAQALLQSRCVALAGGEQSTFIVAGRDALPSEPGGWLSSPVSMEHWMGEDTEHASTLMVRRKGSNGSPPMVAPETETAVLSLRRLTPPGFLVRTFGIDGLTGCRS